MHGDALVVTKILYNSERATQSSTIHQAKQNVGTATAIQKRLR